MDPTAVFRTATSFHQAGQLDEAAALYEQLLTQFPNHPDTLQFRALIDLQRGDFQEALHRFDRALHIKPDYAAAWANRAAALIGLSRYEEAAASAQKALDLDPALRGGFTNRAIALNHLSRPAEALAVCDQALARGIEEPALHHARAAALEALGGSPDATAVALPQDDKFVSDALGLLADGALIPALNACETALTLNPKSFSARVARARVLHQLRRYPESIIECDAALALDPESAQVYALRGLSFMENKQPERALADFEVALEIDPSFELIAGEAIFYGLRNCDWDGFEKKVSDLLAAIDAGHLATQPFALNSLPATPAQHLKIAARWFAKNNPRLGPAVHQTRAFNGKIRIGYFSSDLHEHPVGQLIVGLLQAHDRSQFEVVAFSFGGSPHSETRGRIERACDEFFDVAGMTDIEVARLACEKNIHIAIDLNGYTASARTGIFAAGAAPVQVNYLGYPSTLGSPCHHYIIGDSIVTPPEHYVDFSERVVTMPDSYLVTNDIKRHIPARASTRIELGLPENGFAFCSFNASYKLTPEVFDVWMRLLNAVKGSSLWLNDAGPMAKRNLQSEAKARGVAPERLVFVPRTTGLEYLARYRAADLFLDTFTYNAHATASEALLVGLPVVTCLGRAFAGRVGASVLSAVGLPEMITKDPDEYERLALSLALNPDHLSTVRVKLEKSIGTHPLFDTKRYAQSLEYAYRAMWSRYEQGLAPDHITVR